MTKNVKLLSLIGIAAALAGGSVAISNLLFKLLLSHYLLVTPRVPLLNGTKLVKQVRLWLMLLKKAWRKTPIVMRVQIIR